MNRFNQKITFYIVIVIIIIVVMYFTFIRKEDYLENSSNFNILVSNEENTKVEENLVDEKNNTSNKIVIYITGAVKNEGVYELEENSRITDSIEKAGGLTEDADINDINLAYVLQDGVKVHIPKKNENSNEVNDDTNLYVSIENKSTENLKKNRKTDKININTASQTELETLPGIGASTASKIINYRKENGRFSSIEDIKKVSGIGDSKYSKIKDLIKV